MLNSGDDQHARGRTGMTPTQLRTFATVARHGSSKLAARELGVTEAAVSGHVKALRKELGDALFERTGDGISFTPGGLRLATRAVEMLGLQEQTRHEVKVAADGKRVLRLSVSSLFAEYAAPGLIEVFSNRADDLGVEMTVSPPAGFTELLAARAVDAAIGPAMPDGDPAVTTTEFLRYQLVVVGAAGSPLTAGKVTANALRSTTWYLGPSAVDPASAAARLLRHVGVPPDRQRIFQNHAAALGPARAGDGVALVPANRLRAETEDGRLARVNGAATMVDGSWAVSIPRNVEPDGLEREFVRFVTTTRATQAMLSGSGASVGRFRPRVHVTLWS
jgi:DNA-binding transcriptional LysR family regulator